MGLYEAPRQALHSHIRLPRHRRRHTRTGRVLQGRFKGILVEKEPHLLELARYVVLNPVRARAVRSARDWAWSSYRATAGMVDAPDFLTTSWILAQFHRSPRRAIELYREFVKQGRGVDAWAELRGGILLGSDEFVDKLKPLLSDYEALKEVPRRERLATRPSLDELFSKVRDKKARDRQIHAATCVHEYTLQAVADFLGLHYSTISMIAKRIAEDGEHCKSRSDPHHTRIREIGDDLMESRQRASRLLLLPAKE